MIIPRIIRRIIHPGSSARPERSSINFVDGRFKTYFALGSNCVLLADSIIGRLGTDVLSMRGLITPGTYLDYLDKEYHKKGSMVITRQFYPMSMKTAQKLGVLESMRRGCSRREKRTEKVWRHEKDTTPFYRQRKTGPACFSRCIY